MVQPLGRIVQAPGQQRRDAVAVGIHQPQPFAAVGLMWQSRAMNVALRRPMTLEEFLAWERQQDLRYEFDGIQPVAMTGGTVARSVIASNIFQALDTRLRDPCRVFRGDLKLIAQNQVRYPDGIVACASVADDADVAPEPVVLFEVLSASTRVVDQTLKAAEYLATVSVQHYVVLEQRRAEVTSLSRATDGWEQVEASGVYAVLRLPALGIEVPMAELYRQVQLLT